MKNNCLLNLLKVINLLQKNSCSSSNTLLNDNYNTRVITLYKKDGSLLETPYNGGVSSYFRISKIDNNCITLLILRLNNGIYYSTSEYITINIRCICAIKCIEDVYVSL